MVLVNGHDYRELQFRLARGFAIGRQAQWLLPRVAPLCGLAGATYLSPRRGFELGSLCSPKPICQRSARILPMKGKFLSSPLPLIAIADLKLRFQEIIGSNLIVTIIKLNV